MEIHKSSGFSAASTSAHAVPESRPADPAAPPQATLLTGTKAAQPVASVQQIQDAIQKVEEAISAKAQDLRFSLDDETGKTVVKIIDEKTQTVLRQIPSVEMLEIAKALDKMQGLLVRNKV